MQGCTHLVSSLDLGVMALHSEQGWEHKLSEKGHGQDSGLSTLGGKKSHYIPTPKSPQIYFTPCHRTSISSDLPLLPLSTLVLIPSLAPGIGFSGNPNTSVLSNRGSNEVGVLQLPHRCAPSCEQILTIYIFVIIESIAECSLCAGHCQPLTFIIPHPHNPLGEAVLSTMFTVGKILGKRRK